jgi:hypothetical protein
MIKSFFLSLLMLFSIAGAVSAMEPLITDDTGTEGKGNAKVKFAWRYERNAAEGVKTDNSKLVGLFTYGIIDTVDVEVGVPYIFNRKLEDGNVTKSDGISDVSLEVKWRLYDKDGLSFAVKPVFTFPAGDEDKGLGTGRTTYGLFGIATKEAGQWAFHLNLGYEVHENRIDERMKIWHLSAASEVEVAKGLKLVADVGAQGNPDKSSNTVPAYALAGVNYVIVKNISLGIGAKFGLNKAEPDFSLRSGITIKFR